MIALQAAHKGLDARLSAAGGVFGTRVTVSVAPSNTPTAPWPYPYVIQFWQGGGEDNSLRAQDAALQIAVKCMSTKFADAFRGAATISAALNDKGEQESPTDFVNGGDEWKILTVTENETIYIAEEVPDSEIVYHAGASYALIMVRR